MDIMIAIVIFIGTIFVFYSILSAKGSSKVGELKDDASILAKNINITQNMSLIEELLSEDYSQLKKKLRVKNEFCLFLEDENGNVIYLSQDQSGIGSGKISISDVPCS